MPILMLFLSLVLPSFFVYSVNTQDPLVFAPDDARNRFEFGAVMESDHINETKTTPLALKDVIIIIRSQHNSYHVRKANALKEHLAKQAKEMGLQKELHVKMMHEDWTVLGTWTIFPIIESLAADYSKSKSWIFFCEEDTVINLAGLLKVLSNYSFKEELFLGHAIQDTHAAIIHHFAFHEDPSQFSFPDFAAGWAISTSLLKKLSKKLTESPLKSDFTIDVKHEIAMFIRDKGKGVLLTDVPEFCTSSGAVESTECVTTFNSAPPDCGELPVDDIFFAVKTTKKFHETRVPIVQKTVGSYTSNNLVYYSETEDPSVPTENIGVPNTERGHCAKLEAIIKRSAEDPRAADKAWLVIIDDDTIMSVPRLQKLLACYDSKEVMLFGERYGYGLGRGFGYEYITGGGGMILSRAGVQALLKSGCTCWEPDSPDDMWLGSCFRRLNVPLTNSPAFHQARPGEYVPSLLAHQTPVSFHKHHDIDPLSVYRDYLS